jgi:hypothetical protein
MLFNILNILVQLGKKKTRDLPSQVVVEEDCKVIKLPPGFGLFDPNVN